MKLLLPVIHTTVFAASAEGGNPCPVVFHADSLSTDQLRSMAAKFEQETAFVLAPQQEHADVRLRYFVPNHEMEMCVHATVGSTTVLLLKELLTNQVVHIETPLGLIKAQGARKSDRVFDITVEQLAPVYFDYNPTLHHVARALGIDVQDIDQQVGPIQSVSTSRAKVIVPLKNAEVLHSLKPDFEYLWKLCDEFKTTGFYPFSIEIDDNMPQVSARQFPKRAGFNEDPATGVAASALASYLVKHGVFKEGGTGWQKVRIYQGFAMGRPSLIEAAAYIEDHTITKTEITGQAVIVAEETIVVDPEM